MAHRFRAGVARVNITPPLGTLLMGYPDPYGQRKAETIHDPLNATAMTYEHGDHRAAVVVLDVGIVEDAHVEAIRQAASKQTGIDPGLITICTIQTHSAPRTQKVFGWCELDLDYIDNIMIPGTVKALVDSAKTVPVRVGFGTAQSDVGVNRRLVGPDNSCWLHFHPDGVYDPTMTVLRFDSAKGPLATIIHYGAHPTVLGSWSKIVSRDWPGIMIDRVEHFTKAPAIYINGAVGDIAPRSAHHSCVGDSLVALAEVGHRASMHAMAAYRSIKELRDVELHTLAQNIDIPLKPLTPLEEAKQNLAAAAPKKDDPGAAMMEYKHWEAVIEEHKKPPRSAKPYHQTLTALGPAVLVPFPGEPFADSILRLRAESPFQYTLGASTSCGNNAYFPTKEEIARGGYEAWINKALGPYLLRDDTADVLVVENVKLLKSLHEKANPPIPVA